MQHDHILIKLGAFLVEGLQGDATYQRPCGFRREDFFMFSYLAYVSVWGQAIFGSRVII